MVAMFVFDDLAFTSSRVDQATCGRNDAANASIGTAHHRPAQLDGAELGIGHVLSGGLAIFEPTVIGNIDDELWLSADKLTSEAPDGVFKANAGDELHLAVSDRSCHGLERSSGIEAASKISTRRKFK